MNQCAYGNFENFTSQERITDCRRAALKRFFRGVQKIEYDELNKTLSSYI